MKFKKHLVVLVVLMSVIILIACGTDLNKNSDQGTTDLEGSVVIDGSGTVYPLIARIAEEYMINEQENVSVEVSRAGTSAGFSKLLVKNGTDFNNASREIKEIEEIAAQNIGIEIKELKIALDGLTFVIHPENNWANELTKEELICIFHVDGQIKKWSDINPNFPDEYIKPYGPNENHGTYEFLWENILNKDDLVTTINLQQEYSTLVNLISEDINGIAFFSYGYYIKNTDNLEAVHVDFGQGPIAPSSKTISEDGDYATFTRPVFTYLNVDHAIEKEQVLDYAFFLMSNINNYAGETGFVPIPVEEVEDSIMYLEGLKK